MQLTRSQARLSLPAGRLNERRLPHAPQAMLPRCFGPPAGSFELQPPGHSEGYAHTVAACLLEPGDPVLEPPFLNAPLCTEEGEVAREQSALGPVNRACRSSPGAPAMQPSSTQ